MINRKKTQRLYKEEGLAVRRRRSRRRAVGTRAPAPVLALPNQRWSLDFVHDQMASGRRFRVLNVVDDVTRECLAAVPDTSISGRRVVRELTKLIAQRGRPGMIVSDNVLCWEAAAATGQQVSLRRSRSALMSFWSRWLPSSRKVLSAIANTGSIDLGGRGPHRP